MKKPNNKCKKPFINKTFINRYNWEGINFPSEKEDWKKFEKKNCLNALYAKKRKYILPMF